MDGVGQVNVSGGALPAVRVELNPNVLNKYGVSLEQVRTVLSQANANRPKGQLSDDRTSWEIHTDDQIFKAVLSEGTAHNLTSAMRKQKIKASNS